MLKILQNLLIQGHSFMLATITISEYLSKDFYLFYKIVVAYFAELSKNDIMWHCYIDRYIITFFIYI